jgi:hypothetical protein
MRATWGIAAAVVAVGLVFAVPSPALAATTTPTGYDISWPQCVNRDSTNTKALPVDHAFGIVGLNEGTAVNFNSCFAKQLAWAQIGSNSHATEQPKAALYLNTGNPGPASPNWPKSNVDSSGVTVSNPHGTCAGKQTESCAYMYGHNVALLDVEHAATFNIQASSYLWWLDVETTNSWVGSPSENSADISGMADYLESQGGTVGLYSTTYQWGKIAGKTSSKSVLAGLQSWLAGAKAATASSKCSATSLTPHSRVSLVQYAKSGFDGNYSCHVFGNPKPSISGTAGVGKKLTAVKGTWNGSPKFSYQWRRDSAAISKATSSTYTTKSNDLGHTITVSITAKQTGYSPYATTSSGLLIARTLTSPKPAISGTTTVGHTLSATSGSWKPAPVTLKYQWNRDGAPIDGATAKSYTLVAADGGHDITFTVTGSKSGYKTVTETSSAHTITPAP